MNSKQKELEHMNQCMCDELSSNSEIPNINAWVEDDKIFVEDKKREIAMNQQLNPTIAELLNSFFNLK
jgi:hypothetical protein